MPDAACVLYAACVQDAACVLYVLASVRAAECDAARMRSQTWEEHDVTCADQNHTASRH